MFEKQIDVSASIHELLVSRWSGVAFDSDRAVSKADILSLVEAARWAPSCYGDEPWRYIIFNKHANPDSWQKAYECLAAGNQPWCQYAPLLIVACHDTLLSMNDKPNGWAQYDTGAASLSLCLQAAQLDIMTHQMAGFNPDQARSSFVIPERFTPITMIAAGYQLAEAKIPEEFKKRETAPRTRNALSENFFMDSWGEGLK